MATSTFGIGCLPTYQTIGTLAPILLVFLRIIQGLSVGGEIPGAITYISESCPTQKGYSNGIIFSALIGGIVLGYVVKGAIFYFFTPEEVTSYFWRIPFLLGGFFGIVIFVLRKKLSSTPGFKPFSKKETAFPFIYALKQHPKEVFLGSTITGLGAIIVVCLYTFLPAYLTNILGLKDVFSWQISLSLFVGCLLCIAFGYLSDKINRFSLLTFSTVIIIITIFPIYWVYNQKIEWLFIALFLSNILVGLLWGNIPAILSELFPQSIRYSGIGISYNLGFAIIGGVTPVIIIFLVKLFNNAYIPVFLILLMAFISLFAVHIHLKKCR